MTDRHEALDRLRSVNPVAGVALLDPDEVVSVVTLCEERRLTPSADAHERPAATPHRSFRTPVLAFAAAFAAIIVTVGIFGLLGRDGQTVVDEPAPATTIQPMVTTTVAPVAPTAIPEYLPTRAFATAIGHDGSIWAATATGVARWLPGSTTATMYTTEDGLPDDNVHRIVTGSEGIVWVGASGWMARFDGSWTTYSAPAGSAGPMAIGPDGAVWSAFGERQLGRFDGSEWEVFAAPLTLDDGVAIPWSGFIDVAPDGTVWAGTHEYKGVFAFDDPNWVQYTTADGLPPEALGTIAVAPDGSVWVGSMGMDETPGGGIAHFDGSTWTVYTTDDGLLSNTADVAVGGDGTVWAIHTGPDGVGVSHFDGATWTAYSDIVGLGMAASVDDSGTLWMPSGDGMIGFDGTAVTRLVLPVDEPPEASAAPIPPLDEWNPILSTTAAKTAPPSATCPAGTDPNAPGPADQERPEPGRVGNLAAAFDRHAGRIVYVDTLGETWTFDVCTNTWHRMDPTGAVIGELSGGLVYDVDSDVTVALGYESVSVYDANTNTWTRPASDGLGFHEANSITPVGGAYDPVTGLIITSNQKWTSETSPLYWEFWAYDVDTNEWTLLGPLRLEPSNRDQLDFLGYSEPLDRLIIGGWVDREVGTVLVDPRTGGVTLLPIETPVVDIGWPNETYGAAGGTVYATTRTMDTPHDICGFDAKYKSWTACFDVPDSPGAGAFPFPALVGDPINNRLLLINGRPSALATASRVGAIDLDTDEWIQLLVPSE